MYMSWLPFTSEIWSEVNALPINYEPGRWDILLLDARALLPDIGPALVLAMSALETRIDDAQHQLAVSTGLNSDLWQWVNDRGDYRKEPSNRERYTKLMQALCGHSLSEDATLWRAFRSLQAARNAFVHEGKPRLDGKDVSIGQAYKLIDSAQSIVDWVQEFLPPSERRPKSKVAVNVETLKNTE